MMLILSRPSSSLRPIHPAMNLPALFALFLGLLLAATSAFAGDIVTKTYYDSSGKAHQIEVYDSRASSASSRSSRLTSMSYPSYSFGSTRYGYTRPVGYGCRTGYSVVGPTTIRTSYGVPAYRFSGGRRYSSCRLPVGTSFSSSSRIYFSHQR